MPRQQTQRPEEGAALARRRCKMGFAGLPGEQRNLKRSCIAAALAPNHPDYPHKSNERPVRWYGGNVRFNHQSMGGKPNS